MIVCIAEKPSVARDIAKIIGANQSQNGYMQGNGYQVTWTFGHLCTLKEPHDYDEKWKAWKLEYLPMIPSKFGVKVIDNSGVQNQFRVIENLIGNAEMVINCGDAGQEGELIQRWVLLKAKCRVPIKRLWISSMTEDAIKEGFENLRESDKYDNLYAAGSARAIGDWLLGMNATRLFTKKFSQGRGVLSIGRVQTPTLAMIVQRQHEIDNFRVDEYWELKTVYRETEFNATIDRLTSKKRADKGLEYLKDKLFTITSFEQKEGKEGNPRLFDLTSLQVEANKKYGYSAEETLNGIQNLYEGKAVTYPRVDTTYLSEDIHPKIPNILQGLNYYKKLTTSLLGTEIPMSKKVFDNSKVTDHHAIIPTGVNPSFHSPKEQHIYDLIVRRFIAAFYPECIVSNTTVLGKVGEIEFKTTGKQVLSAGWREVYDDATSSKEKKKKEEEKILPIFQEGETGPHTPRIHHGKTTPPKYYTEATLLRAMETAGKQVDDEEMRELMKENGIGRPSTRANIIETLIRRKYIQKQKKNLIATPTGMGLVDLIQNELLKSAELTGQWEKKLRLIEKGTYSIDEFKTELIQMVQELTQEVLYHTNRILIIPEEKKEQSKPTRERKTSLPKTGKTKVKINEKPTLTCPKCKQFPLLKGKTAYGCKNYKECGFKIPFEILGKKITEKQISDLVTKGKTEKIEGFVIPGSQQKKDACLVLDETFNVQLEE